MRWRGDSDDEFAEPLLDLRKIHPLEGSLAIEG
jgi:hypothetical protein